MAVERTEMVLRAAGCAEGVVEAGTNAGRAVERILKRVGLSKGDPWCAAWVYDVGRAMLDDWPLPKTGSCDVLLQYGKTHNLLHNEPLPGDVFLILHNPNDAVHTGFVTAVAKNGKTFSTIEGNTNPDGGREGFGVFRRTRTVAPGKVVFLRWTTQGKPL